MSLILGEWREGKVRPLQGNTPRDRPVSRGISGSLWSICDDPFPATRFPQLFEAIPGARYAFFKAWAESIWSDGVSNVKTKSWEGTHCLPPVGPGSRQKNASGGTRSFSSSADEFRPAIPRSGCSPAVGYQTGRLDNKERNNRLL